MHIVVMQHIIHRCVAGDVVVDGEKEAGVLLADSHTTLDFGPDLGFGAGKQDARVRDADEP